MMGCMGAQTMEDKMQNELMNQCSVLVIARVQFKIHGQQNVKSVTFNFKTGNFFVNGRVQ
jgi:hypothetical protein